MTLALVVVLGVSALAPASWFSSVGIGACASAASGHAGLVVDFGAVTNVAGAPTPTVQSSCLAVSSSSETGSDLLRAAGHSMRWQGGLLCAIDGYPATGCGVRTATGYQYWSYWHGGSSWTYSSVGPSSYRVSAGGVDGWHFVEGADSASEGTPRAVAAGPCPAPTPTTTPHVRGADDGGGCGDRGQWTVDHGDRAERRGYDGHDDGHAGHRWRRHHVGGLDTDHVLDVAPRGRAGVRLGPSPRAATRRPARWGRPVPSSHSDCRLC